MKRGSLCFFLLLVARTSAFDVAPVSGAAPASGEAVEQLPESKTMRMAMDLPEHPRSSPQPADAQQEAPKEPIGDFVSSPLSSDMLRRSEQNPLNDGAAPDKANGVGQEAMDPQKMSPGSVGAVDPLSSDKDSYTLRWARESGDSAADHAEGNARGTKAAPSSVSMTGQGSAPVRPGEDAYRFQRAKVTSGHKAHLAWQGVGMGFEAPAVDAGATAHTQWGNEETPTPSPAATKPTAPVPRSDQTDVPATFFNPTTPYQYSNGEMHFPVFHGHQLESNQWAVGHKAQQSGIAPRPSASAVMRQDAPRFQRVSEKSEHIYPLRGRFHLRDAADPSSSVHHISKAVRSAFHLAPGVPVSVDKAPRFVETAAEVHNVQSSSQLHKATADGMRFQQIQTHMGMGSGEIEDAHAGPRYNWAPGAPDPNKMQWYQSPTIMYPQNPSLRPLGNMDPASGITGSSVPLQTAPTPPATYPQHTDPEAFPNEIATTAPAEAVNAPLPPPSPPKFMEVKAVTGYASPRSATTQSIWLQQPPTQSTVQAIQPQQQPMLSPTMQQQYQLASTAQPAVAAQYIAPAVQQPVQYVMTTQPQAQMQQQVQPPVLTQQGQRPPSINSQQPVVINLVLPNGAPQASGVNNAAASAQSTRLNTTPEQPKVVRPSDGLPTTHMQIAELSTVQVSDRHDIPQPPAMRDAPQAK